MLTQSVLGFVLVLSKVHIKMQGDSIHLGSVASSHLFWDHLKDSPLTLRVGRPCWCRICLFMTLFLLF